MSQKISSDKYSIFSLEKNHSFPSEDAISIRNLRICSNIAFFINEKDFLVRLPLDDPKQRTELKINIGSNESVHRLFVDPRGNHIILTLSSGKNFYTSKKLKKLRALSKLKNQLINSVAWNRYNTNEQFTHAILIATSDGTVYESNFDNNTSNLEMYWTKCCEIRDEIIAIELVRFPPSSGRIISGENQKSSAIITTKKSLHIYTGWVNFENLQNLKSQKSTSVRLSICVEPGILYQIFESSQYKCVQLPDEALHSGLDLFYPRSDREIAKSMAWLCQIGVYYANIDDNFLDQNLSFEENTSVALLTKPEFIKLSVLLSKTFKKAQNTIEMAKHFPPEDMPRGLLATEAHVILFFRNRIKAFNTLNQAPMFNQSTDAILNSEILDMIKDPVTHRLWAYSRTSLVEIKLEHESQRIWKVYLEVKDFEKARSLCKDKNDLELLNIHEAEYWYSKKKYFKAARLYAQTNVAFEKVALQLSTLHLSKKSDKALSELKSLPIEELDDTLFEVDEEIDENEVEDDNVDFNTKNDVLEQDFISVGPLKVYLKAKLENLKKSDALDRDSAEQSLTSIVVIWSIELWLHEIGSLITNNMCNNEAILQRKKSLTTDKISTLRMEIRSILNDDKLRPIIQSNKETLYELFKCNGDESELIYLCQVLQDYDILIDHYMFQKYDHLAIQLLETSNHPGVIERHYRYSLRLSKKFPEELVRAWTRFDHKLDPKRLFNAIMNLPCEVMVGYLEFLLIQRKRQLDTEFHQLLILKYVKLRREEQLIEYLNDKVSMNNIRSNELDMSLETTYNEAISDLMKITDETGDKHRSLSTRKMNAIATELGLALNLCKTEKLDNVVLFILQKLGLNERALDISLEQKNYTFAREIIGQCEGPIESKRALWLKLVKHEIENSQEPAKKALKIMEECHFISFEDILPSFKDSVTVEELKGAICACLDGFNKRIEELRESMNATSMNAQEMKKQIDRVRSKPFAFNQKAKCTICFFNLMASTFYIFPCGHQVHSDCLLKWILQSQVDESISHLSKMLSYSSGSKQHSDELEDFFASNCPICGDTAIKNSIIPYFKTETTYKELLSDWLI